MSFIALRVHWKLITLYLGFVSARPSYDAVWAAVSAISRGQDNNLKNGLPAVSYERCELQFGLHGLYDKTGNKTYHEYIKPRVDLVVSDDRNIIGDYK
jgi:hypothetical protein